MAPRHEVTDFVRAALERGRGRDEIRDALARAGWRERDIGRALAAFADDGFLPPVPRPRPFASARDAAIYALGFFALGVVVVNGVAELFALVDRVLGTGGPFDRAEAWRLAALAVFLPLFLALDLRAERENPVRKTCAYAAFFFATLVLLFTLVGVIAVWLTGGLGLELALKAAILATAAAAVLLYYRRDLRQDADRSWERTRP